MTSTVYIAKNVYGGDGMGRLGDGRVVFVPGAFAGENVKAEFIEEKRNFVKARLVEIVEPSPERIGRDGKGDGSAPVVPGMVYSDLSYRGECEAKRRQLVEFFDRARIVHPEIGQSTNRTFFNYRNKAVYHFAKQKGKWVLGYRTEPSHEIVDVTVDPLASPEINAKLPEIRRQVLALLTQGAEVVRKSVEKEGNVTVRWTSRSGVQWWIGRAKQPVVMKELTCGKVFEVPSDGFYQVNPEVGEELVKAVVAEFKKSPTEELLDLYCGVGVFGLCCAPAKLTGIESGRQAIEFAKKNASSQNYAGARFYAEEVGRNLKRIRITERTTVVVDPPRAGMEPNVPKWLAESKAPRIFYVSCDPATLMRDLRTLTRNYEVESVRWFNMFPRTARFETLVVLKHR
ncbi:MAG: methyltransferase [Kiritimatiellia bacterium]|nr:methyltransferase [Kiritimatiellia bacterium]